MEELQLHSDGQNVHLKALKEKFEQLKQHLKSDTSLSDTQRKENLKEAKTTFEQEKKQLNSKLF